MAPSQDTLLVTAAVVAILVGVMVYNRQVAAKAKGRVAAGGPAAMPSGDPILQRYVHHDGAIVGQAIAVDGDRVILRQGTTLKAVPRTQLDPSPDGLKLVGAIDWAQAERDGALWGERGEASPTEPK